MVKHEKTDFYFFQCNDDYTEFYKKNSSQISEIKKATKQDKLCF